MDTILTLEEVAQYLRVSERTVKEWATNGDLPGGKIGGSWRFRRGDIESWLNTQLTAHKHSRTIPRQYTVQTLLNPKHIAITNVTTKADFINHFIDQGAELAGVTSRTEIADAVFKRENLMSTGIGLGIAVPHVRLNHVKEVNIFMAVNQSDISDYGTLDTLPVRIGLFFVVGRDQHSEYIKALSVMVERLKNSLIRERILSATSVDAIYQSLVEADA